jgi:hypothetical protein
MQQLLRYIISSHILISIIVLLETGLISTKYVMVGYQVNSVQCRQYITMSPILASDTIILASLFKLKGAKLAYLLTNRRLKGRYRSDTSYSLIALPDCFITLGECATLHCALSCFLWHGPLRVLNA